MRLFSACVFTGLVLQIITHEINHALTPWAIAVVTAGMPVTFAGLRLDSRDGWKVVTFLGLCTDAVSPVHFGVHGLLYLTVFAFLQRVRQRVPRDEMMVGTLFAMVASVAIHLGLTLIYLWRGPNPGRLFERILWEWGLSALFVALITPWFFALTERSIQAIGASLRREQRGLF